ncbi:MAG: hypothetical protein ACQEWM_12685 [Actinomycetota bacterium]
MSTTDPNDATPRSRPYDPSSDGQGASAAPASRSGTPGDRDGDGIADHRAQRRADRDGDGIVDDRERRPVEARRAAAVGHDRETVVARERERFGGVKIGSAFFGWLTATGALVLLTALAAAIAALIASLTGGVDDAVEGAQRDLQSTGIWGIVILLVIWFLAYYCGGYVAGRMARFDGAKQGVAVWVWAVVIAIVAAVIGLVAGQNFALPPGSMPTLPLPEDQATTAAIISAVVVAIVALVGAVLGGLAGMRFHRRVDRAGFDVGAAEPR